MFRTKSQGRRNSPEGGAEWNRRTIQNGHFNPHFNLLWTDSLRCGRSSQFYPGSVYCLSQLRVTPKENSGGLPIRFLYWIYGDAPPLSTDPKPGEITKVPQLICVGDVLQFASVSTIGYVWPSFGLLFLAGNLRCSLNARANKASANWRFDLWEFIGARREEMHWNSRRN